MSKLVVRTDPVANNLKLRDAMDRLISDSFVRPFWPFDSSVGAFSLDMYETNDAVVVKAAIPGIKSEDINITISGELLTIQGETRQEEETKESTYYIREQQYGTFSRTLNLPTAVVADKAEAEFENGILKLTLPKAEEVKPKVISVKAKKK
ncbi:MAG: Hsp20/alpha crystallin family protein [Anaerolineae bacterium]|nr:Hsp20/alpha crystallin family protein [Anaerolineae bacterium]